MKMLRVLNTMNAQVLRASFLILAHSEGSQGSKSKVHQICDVAQAHEVTDLVVSTVMTPNGIKNIKVP